MGTGAPPTPWADLVIEIMVRDYVRTFAFWVGLLGFDVAFSRPSQKLACLRHPDGAQIMFYERDGDWETGVMEPPYGRGAVIQVFVHDLNSLAENLRAAHHPFYVEPREKWRDWGDRLGGQREFLVQDPDGYLVMIAERLGERPLP